MHCCDYYSDDVFCWFLFKDQCEPLLSDQFQIIHILIKQLIGFYFKYTVTLITGSIPCFVRAARKLMGKSLASSVSILEYMAWFLVLRTFQDP